jgi:hypothetical protein
MQFKGSLRPPGDRGPGVRVVLEVDEYHLEIRGGNELLGRYYLADVEVARDIAERFTLFLGDDELEFLADDALQFAYEGVSAMQEAWLAGKRKRRRHRRAADQAAARKDREPVVPQAPPVEEQPPRADPSHRPQSELALRLARLEAEAAQRRISDHHTGAEIEESGPTDHRQLPAVNNGQPDAGPAATPKVPKPQPEPVPAAKGGAGQRLPKTDSPAKAVKPAKGAPVAGSRDAPAAKPAATGHHPAETSGGLLSRLRRQPKVPEGHVHTFREAGSSVGLSRRVCIECSYVSIGSED